MRSIRKLRFLLYACIASFPLYGESIIKDVRIKFFPDEKYLNLYDYSLGKYGSFDFADGKIYFCSTNQHEIQIIGMDGKLYHKFGRVGQGPGEFIGPSCLRIIDGKIIIYDAGNGRFQRYSLDGKYESQFKILERVYEFRILADRLIVLPSYPQSKNGRTVVPIVQFDLDGNNRKEIEILQFNKTQSNDQIDTRNVISVDVYQNQIHCLQKYGTNYRIFDFNGKLLKNIELEIDSNFKQEREKLKSWSWIFNSFCLADDLIYASCGTVGKVLIFVFDFNGRLIKILRNIQIESEKYACDEIKIVEINNKKYALMLFRLPECTFGLLEI
jgi:hypothetical protein